MPKKDIPVMQTEELQALRDQAEAIRLRDHELGKFCHLLVLHLAHAHGLDPLAEDEKAREAKEAHAEETRQKEVKAKREAHTLTPAEEESQRQAKAQGRQSDFVPGDEHGTRALDPLAKENQRKGFLVVPSAQEGVDNGD